MWETTGKYEEVRNVLLLHVSLRGNGTGNQTDRPTYARTYTSTHVHVPRNALGLALHLVDELEGYTTDFVDSDRGRGILPSSDHREIN